MALGCANWTRQDDKPGRLIRHAPLHALTARIANTPATRPSMRARTRRASRGCLSARPHTHTPVDAAVILSPFCTLPSSTSTRHTTPLRQGRARCAGGWAGNKVASCPTVLVKQSRDSSPALTGCLHPLDAAHPSPMRRSPVLVMVRIKQQHAQVSGRVALGWRDALNQRWQQRGQAQP